MTIEDDKELLKEGLCPVCTRKLAHKGGCVECEACGWSLCEEA